jgi:hypothetical protein
VINLDKMRVNLNCSRCDFQNEVTLRQVRVEDVIICRGCKANIQLIDHMKSMEKSLRSIRRTLRALEAQLSQLGDITIRF